MVDSRPAWAELTSAPVKGMPMPVTANEVNDCKPADVLLVGSSWPDATCQPRQAVCMVRQHHWGLHVCMKGRGQEQASAGSFTTRHLSDEGLPSVTARSAVQVPLHPTAVCGGRRAGGAALCAVSCWQAAWGQPYSQSWLLTCVCKLLGGATTPALTSSRSLCSAAQLTEVRVLCRWEMRASRHCRA